MIKKILADRYLLLVLIICVINIVLHKPYLRTPALWDEALNYKYSIFIEHNNFNPYILADTYKPPFMYMFPALATRYFSQSVLWGKLEILFFSSLSLYYLYRLGELLFSKRVGLTSLLLFASYPMFFNMSNRFLDPIPFTALFLASLYYFINNRKIAYCIAMSLLLLTKEVGLLLTCTLFIYSYIYHKPSKITGKKNISIPAVFHFIPLCFFAFWMIINKIYFGWFLWPFNTEIWKLTNLLKLTPYDLFTILFNRVFLYKSWILLCIVFLGTLVLACSKKFKNKTIIKYFVLFIFIIVSNTICLTLGINAINPRYYLQLYPLIFLLFSILLELFPIHHIAKTTIVFMLCIYFIGINMFLTRTQPSRTYDETSLTYLNEIKLIQKVITILQNNYQGIFILTSTFTDFFNYPLLGYTTTNIIHLNLSDCSYTNELATNPTLIERFKTNPKILYITDTDTNSYRFKTCNIIKQFHPVETICLDNKNTVSHCYIINTNY